MKQNLWELLTGNEIKLSKAQKEICDYVIKYPLEASFITIEGLANKIGTSTTTVMRFCAKLGYQGFSDLQEDLQAMVKEHIAPHGRLEVNADNLHEDSLFFKCAQKAIQNITATEELIPAETYKEIVQAVLKAKKVFVFGIRTSHTVAYFLFQGLSQIMDDCRLIKSTTIIDQLSDADKDTVLIVVSLPRYAKETLALVKATKTKCKSKVIAITDSYKSPISEYADIVVPCHYESMAFFNSMSAPLFVAEYIITAVAIARKTKTKQKLEKLEGFFNELDFHVN